MKNDFKYFEKMRMKIGVLIVFVLLGFLLQAQDGNRIDDRGEYISYIYIEESPVFKGELDDFICENLCYPDSALRDSITGTVYVDFIIDKSGNTIEHKVVRGIREDLDQEALRVARLIKFDQPATQKGKPVIVSFRVPIKFKHCFERKSFDCPKIP